MSTLKANTVTTLDNNTDLTITGGGTGVPNLEAGTKLNGTALTSTFLSDVTPGTSGNLLTSNGSAWTSAAASVASAYGTLISAQTASASATIDFTSLSGYDIYTLVCEGVVPATDSNYLVARVSTSATFNSGAGDYDYQANGWNAGSSTAASTSESATEMWLTQDADDMGSTSGESAGGIWTFYNLNSSALATIVEGRYVMFNVTPRLFHGQSGGAYTTAEANDGIRIYMGSGNITSGTFALFGSNI